MLPLTIDDRQIEVPKGTLVVDAAAMLGIEIPIFCSHPKLDPVACCRMCLVEISGPRGMLLQTACSVPVAQDMVVKTNTQQVQDMQEANLAFLLVNHPLDCPICDKGGECPLQDQTMRFGPGISQLVEPKRQKKKHYTDLRHDRARSRALRTVLALHPLPGRVGRSPAARTFRARRRHDHRRAGRQAGGRQDQWQHHRYLSRWAR